MNAVIKALSAVLVLTGAGTPSSSFALDPPTDPYFASKGAWGQSYEDMWALHRIGLTAGADSAWRLLPTKLAPVTVAVIDTGLDWNHLDISWDNLWRNPKEVGSTGKVPARGGYVDDVIGWDFVNGDNHPWDYDGHGTFVTGLIAATWSNGAGIAGINPAVRIMVLRALNDFGHTRASYIAEAIVYAADNGARVINVSVGGQGTPQMARHAVEYAVSKGVLIVTSAGNDGVELKDYALAGLDGVITVGASDHEDNRIVFSNWGSAVDIVAPGIDILSLRARSTDTLRDIPGATYTPDSAYVGADMRYYVAGGTSFSAPLVTGVASLLFAMDPTLTAVEVKRMILNSARDVGVPGIDQFTGHGLLDARAALKADRNFYIDAAITGVTVAQEQGATFVALHGTADSDSWKDASVEIGAGESPAQFKAVASVQAAVRNGIVARVPAAALQGSAVWQLRVVVRHRNGRTQQARFRLQLG